MTRNEKSETARFIQWNDGIVDARKGVTERSKDVDYIAGYRYGQHITILEGVE